MVAISKCRGHDIHFDGEWQYVDDDTSVKDNHRMRPCGKCNRLNTADDHDPCIANLPGVRNACCGHGEVSGAYVQFENMRLVTGEAALIIARNLTRSD